MGLIFRTTSLTIVYFVLQQFCSSTEAHTSLFYPKPYRDGYDKYCFPNKYPRACPKINISGSLLPMLSSKNKSFTTWQRGKTYRISWKVNNHHSGFISFSLIPLDIIGNVTWKERWIETTKRMFDSRLHRQFSIYMGCYKQTVKGSMDIDSIYSTRIRIPKMFPNGMYVFSLLWFGGFPTREDSTRTDKLISATPTPSPSPTIYYRPNAFSDHRSCAIVKIKGGKKLRTKGKYQPVFNANSGNINPARVPNNLKCEAVLDRPFLYTLIRTNGLKRQLEPKPDCKIPDANERKVKAQIRRAFSNRNLTRPYDYNGRKPRLITFGRLNFLRKRFKTL